MNLDECRKAVESALKDFSYVGENWGERYYLGKNKLTSALNNWPEDNKGFVDFWHAQAEWSRKAFGPDNVRGPAGPLKHLKKEVDETLANPTDLEEYVDCLFLVCDATRRAGFSPEQLLQVAFAKLEKNKARVWPPTSTDEPVEHVRES